MAAPFAGVAEVSRALEAGEVTAEALVEQVVARADAHDGALGSLVQRRGEAALAAARASDARRAQGAPLGPLDGVPLALKDNLSHRGEPLRCASNILEGYVAPYDATAVARLEAQGVVVVARTNMDEFAMGSSNEHSCYGPTRNPWDPERAPGGSSGGSAAAIAAGVVPGALGSDTGGSIRQPAAFCGITGMKPTYGRVSRYGLVAYASSLDQIGPMGRTARDCALLLDAMSGHDPRDSTSLPEPPTACRDALSGEVAGLVIGMPRECFGLDGCDPDVLAAVREGVAELERAGAKVREVSLPHTHLAIAIYYLIATAEASSNLARFDGVRYGHRAEEASDLTDMYRRTRSEGFGAEVQRRILLGTYVLSAGYYDAYYRRAQRARTLMRRDFAAAFEGCDVIALPTAPEVAFRIGEKSDPLTMYLSDVFTVSANLAGLPGVSVPCGLAKGLPVGLQLLGRAREDETVLRVADAYQRVTDHHTLRPRETG